MEAMAVLAEPTRRRIVELLADGERPAGEIASHFRVSGPAISRHLRVLRDSGVVTYTRDAQRWVYALNPEPIEEVDRWMRDTLLRWQQRFDALGAHLDEMAKSDEKRGVPSDQPRRRSTRTRAFDEQSASDEEEGES
jgi:DNA-binding transcriptional ArsR family regulator